MQIRFLQNLGTDDTRTMKDKLGVDVDAKACVIGGTVDLPEEVIEFLSKKYTALFEPAVRSAGKKTETVVMAK